MLLVTLYGAFSKVNTQVYCIGGRMKEGEAAQRMNCRFLGLAFAVMSKNTGEK